MAATATPQLTSTTAPGKVFGTRKDLADHYKSDWHKYNLKRREAGLPLLLESDFEARLAAALSLRQEQGRNGTSHLKKGKVQKPKKNKYSDNKNGQNAAGGAITKSQAAAYDKIKEDNEKMEDPVENAMDNEEHVTEEGGQAEDEEETIVIDPRQCLFDRHFSATVEANADRMYRKYGFFLPDREYLTDLEGLLGYCHEKIKVCHRVVRVCVCFF